jgi:hypothetical protein
VQDKKCKCIIVLRKFLFSFFFFLFCQTEKFSLKCMNIKLYSNAFEILSVFYVVSKQTPLDRPPTEEKSDLASSSASRNL